MRIFVYGSLRRKQGNSHWMTNAQWLGAHSVDDYQLYSLGHYPGAVPGEGTVHGEVYRIDASTLAELDALRTKGGEYARHLIQTPYGSAWMYVYLTLFRKTTPHMKATNPSWLARLKRPPSCGTP